MATGYAGDRIVIYLARKNGGYKEPEMRLWTLCFSFVYGAVGYMTYGWASENGRPWIAIAIGLGCMIAHGVSAASLATAYAMECFEGVCCFPLSSLHMLGGPRLLKLIRSTDCCRTGRSARDLLVGHQFRGLVLCAAADSSNGIWVDLHFLWLAGSA